jgi:hypothetical protein
MIGRHADQQMDTYATAVNKASADTELQTIGANYNNDEAFNSHLEDYKRAKFREAQTLYGANMDPAIGQNVITRATSEAVAARIHGYIAQNDLGGAARVLGQNEGALEPTVAAHFHGILSEANVTGAVDRAMGNPPQAPAAPGGGLSGGLRRGGKALVTPDQVTQEASRQGVDPALANATAQIESNHGANLGVRGNIFQLGAPERARMGAAGLGAPEEQLEYGVRFLAQTKADLSDALGRDPANSEIYLAHQQGVAGAKKLLDNPGARAGDLVGDAAIRGNGGDPNAPAAQFTDLWRERYRIAEGGVPAKGPQLAQGPALAASDAGPQALATGKPDYPSAIANINRDPSLNPIERQHALSLVHQQYTLDYEIEQRNDRVAEKQLKDQQTANEAELFANAVRKQPLDQKTLADMVQKRQITPAGYNAIMGEVNRADQGQDNPDTVVHLWQRVGQGEDVTQDIYNGLHNGAIKGPTADALIKAVGERQKQETNQIERTAFSTLRTIAGMDAQEHPMVDLDRAAQQAQVALWGQAQTEWNQRVLINKEPPMTVLADMAPRYGHPVLSPEALPRPQMGPLTKLEEIPQRVMDIQDALQSGRLTQDQYMRELRLTQQYQQVFEDQQRRAGAQKTVPPVGGGGVPRVLGVTRQVQ